MNSRVNKLSESTWLPQAPLSYSANIPRKDHVHSWHTPTIGTASPQLLGTDDGRLTPAPVYNVLTCEEPRGDTLAV